MKINEITGYKNNEIYLKAKDTFSGDPPLFDKFAHRSNNFRKFTNFLVDSGFRLVGKGSYGAVYEKPGYPWLFKIFTDDTPYEKYIRWAIANQSNPHVPKIKGGLLKINNRTFAVRMEKLAHFSSQLGDEKIQKLRIILSKYEGEYGMERSEKNWLTSTYPKLLQVVDAIEKIYHSDDSFGMDMHGDSGNIMLRGDVPVITDPLYDVHNI